MRIRIQDAEGKYIVFDSLFPLKTHTNHEGTLILECQIWETIEFNRQMYDNMFGTPTNTNTNKE